MSTEFKIGEWVTCEGYTFVIVHIGDYCLPGTIITETAYFDVWYEGHITYHCEKATQKDIEFACKEMFIEGIW
jgi:hypothetical protein